MTRPTHDEIAVSEEDAPKGTLARSMLANMAWRFIGLYSRAFLSIFVFATLSRLLSPEDFGVMGVATIFVALAEIFSDLGVGPAIIQRRDLNRSHLRVGFTTTILFGMVMVLALWAGAPLVARFFRDGTIAGVLYGVSFSFLFSSFGAVSEALLRRNLQFKKLMWVDLGSYTLGYAVVGLSMAWNGFGVWSLVGATLSQSFLKSVFLLVAQPHPMRPSFARQELRELVYFGGGMTLSRLFAFGASRGDYFVVGRALGVGLLGTYTRADRLMNLPANYVGRVLDTVLFPVMGKIQNQIPRLTKFYLTGVATISLACAPLSMLMAVAAPEIVSVVLGSQWTEAVLPFQILAFAVLPRVSYKIDNSLAKALGAVYKRSARDAVYAVAVVLGTWIGLRWGLPGVAVGVLFAVILNNVMAFRMSLGLLGCSPTQYLRAQAPGFFMALVVGSVAMPTRHLCLAYSSPDWLTLALTSLAGSLAVAALFVWRPKRIVGVYGTSAVVMVFESVPRRFFPRFVLQWFDDRVVRGTA
jgi:PST family polysaccharide transporter